MKTHFIDSWNILLFFDKIQPKKFDNNLLEFIFIVLSYFYKHCFMNYSVSVKLDPKSNLKQSLDVGSPYCKL